MSKDGSEDVVVQQPGQEEGPATGMSPSPGIGAVRIRHILERVAPQFAKEYRDLLTEAGFDTLESLTLPYSEFREEVQGMKPGHARALDVISGRKKDSYTNITKLVNATLNGIGGPSRVHESADHAHLKGLHTDQGIVNDSSNMSCLSISQRAAKGWLFWASGRVAQLVTPTRVAYNFLLKEGLYRLTKRVTNYNGVMFGPREAFGQQVFYHLDKAQLDQEWSTNGREAIWVGRSDQISQGHIVVPIEWDPNTRLYILKPTTHVDKVRFERVIYPLKMGPAQDAMSNIEREESFNTYIEDFFRPWYRSVEGDKDCTEYQIEGEDPIMEIEGIEGHMGKGAKLKYLVKWKGHEIKTYEPWQHLHKYGAKEAIEQYRMKNKMRTSKKANLGHSRLQLG